MSTETRGRPRLREDHEILQAALEAFARHGYDAMSLRSLNTELGLAHGTINQRFKSKEQLYFAAVDHGFATFIAEIARVQAQRPTPATPLDELAEMIRAFLVAAAARPELGRLMNSEGLQRSDRLDHIVRTVLEPSFMPFAATLRRLVDDGVIHPVSARALFFLVAHGAEAPYTLTALSSAFDDHDGVLDESAHAEMVTSLIVRGLRRD
jgi:AcrR family transcriptional regulator